MSILDTTSFLLVLFSLAKRHLQQKNAAEAFPLSDLEPDLFAALPWHALDLTGEDQAALHRHLRTMFPPNGPDDPGVRLDTPMDMAGAVFAEWERGTKDFVYTSSGTTGTPKLLRHPLESMEQELGFLPALFQGVRRIFALTPQYHCFGFTFGVVLHKHLQVPLHILPPLPTVVRHALLEKGGGTLVAGYPDFWARMPKPGFTPPPDSICLSAGSPWPDASISLLRDNGYRIVEIFGSSENGTMGARQGPDDFILLDFWHPEREEESGEVVLKRVLPSGRRVRHEFQDVLRWSGPRSFRPMRRKDFAVQVSGVNVYPMRISAVLEQHPLVAQCRVRLMRPEEGARLKAFIVPHKGADPLILKNDLKALAKERLRPPERPVKFTFGHTLPKSGFGKDTDWE